MKFKHGQKLAVIMIFAISTEISAGMNGIIVPQGRSRVRANRPVTTNSSSASATAANQAAATATSTATPATTKTISSTVDPTIMNQIKADFNSALTGGVIPNIGQTMSWANGTLTRTAANELKYVNSHNGYYETTLTKDSDLIRLAKDSGDIRHAWMSQYGVDLGGLDQTPTQLEAFRTQVTHLYMYGLGDNYTKENPWIFGMGLGAYKKDGQLVYFTKDGPISYNDLLKTNEYKALAGTNIVHTEVETPATPAAPVMPAIQVAGINPNGSATQPNTTNHLDYLGSVNNSSIDMLITASARYRAGTITKDQYISVALRVSQMAEYYRRVNAATGTAGTSTSAPAVGSATTPTTSAAASNANQRVLIGTANNGQDKIYVIRQNSQNSRYGSKVVIVPAPGNVIASTEYELLIPNSEIRPGSNELENILAQIPDGFKVDKTADNKPIVKSDPNAAGLWRVTKESGAICVHNATAIPQPTGSCTIGATAKSSSGAGWANDRRPAEKECIERGFEKVKYEFDHTCIVDIYQNAGGM